MNMKIGTMKRIAILLVVVGVISAAVGLYTIFIDPYAIWGDYSRCRFTQSAECQVVTKAPSWGLILIIIGALLYRSARTRKGGVVPKDSSQVA
jgi:H+/Cl- antiporter ClcA